jgi:chorismate mutase
MWCRGIRGAITVPENSKESIMAATKRLLQEMVQANGIEVDDIASIIFTTTPDLNATFPAAATRELGWPRHLALLCTHEMNVPGSLPRCVRVLMLANSEKSPDGIVHVYLEEATKLKQTHRDNWEAANDCNHEV